MKYVLIAIVFCACSSKPQINPYATDIKPPIDFPDPYKIDTLERFEVASEIRLVIIDSCEYLITRGQGSAGICHKGNCKFCAARAKKELPYEIVPGSYNLLEKPILDTVLPMVKDESLKPTY